MRRFYPLLMSRAFGDASGVLGIDIAFNLDNPFVQEVLQDLAKLVRGVAETTRDEIRALVGRQAAEGWSVEQLADAIRERGITASETRAATVARSETATAYSRGSILAYRESGVVEQIEWITAGSDVCPICQALNGKRAPLGGSFADGIGHPAAHPNCRCAILPIVS